MAEEVEDTKIMTLAELERTHIEATLKLLDDNKTLAAKALGIDRRTLYRKLAAFELEDKADRPIPYTVHP
jgi:DNA-binding protein Fis